jgi:hypothetical protein
MERKEICGIVERLTLKNKLKVLSTIQTLDLKVVEGADGVRINLDRVTAENVSVILAQAQFLKGLESIERKQNAAEF